MRLGADGFHFSHVRPAAAWFIGGILLSLAALCGGSAGLAQNEPPQQPEEPTIAGEMVFSSRVLRRDLERAVRALDEGRTAAGLVQLQSLLDADSDSFVDFEDRRRTSVRSEALRRLGSLDRDALRIYEDQVTADARGLLAQAHRTEDFALFSEVARRFYFTAEGFAAADWLAARWLDQGRPSLAARVWSSLVSEPAHRHRVTPVILAKAALAQRLSGDAASAAPLAQRLNGRPVSLGGQPLAVLDWTARQSGPRAADGNPDRWLVPHGNAARNRPVSASTPLLQPIWSVPFFAEHAALRDLVHEWETQQLAAPEPTAVAGLPLVLDSAVVVRDADGIRGVDRKSGRMLWTYACEASLTQTHAAVGAELDIGRAYAANANLGTLSSDGERIYAIGGLDVGLAGDRRAAAAGVPMHRVRGLTEGNRLIALPVAPAGAVPQPVWSVGGTADAGTRRDKLAGHFFFGPPLPLDGRLYALTEKDRQINLVMLDPQTGELLRVQALAFADHAAEDDGDRALGAVSPAFADGVLVCPTDIGLLIGVDLVSERLMWSYVYNANERVPGHRYGGIRVRTAYGHGGFADLPHIHRQRIVCLPRDADAVHCLDLLTGERRWTVPRDDAEYVGAVTDETVVVVGRRACRGLSLETGRQQWTAPVGMPSGRGVHAGTHYLVPLQDGRVAALEIATGRETGLTRLLPSPGAGADDAPARDQWPLHPGNLVAAGEVIVSVGPHGLAAYPQSAALLNEVQDRLAGGPTLDDLVLATELELNLGNLPAAREHLATAMRLSSDGPARRRAEDMLRELLYTDLHKVGADEAAILAQLGRLATSPPERARLLAQTAEHHLRGRRPDAALRAVREFVELPLDAPLPVTGDRSYLVSPKAWAQAFLGRLRQRFGPAELARVEAQVESDRQAALASGAVADLERFLAVYGSWPQAASVRTELARCLIEEGEYQRAELLLLANRQSDDPQITATALCELAWLWDHLAQFAEAAELLEKLETQFADVPVNDRQTGAQFVAMFRRTQADPLTEAAARERHVTPPVSRVQITETRWWKDQPDLLDLDRGYLRDYNLPADASFHILEQANAEEPDVPTGRLRTRKDGSTLDIIDKETGRTMGHVQLPAAVSASESRDALVGHFLPLASRGALHGVSLLELDRRAPLWTTSLPEPAAQGEIKIGPAGPTFCTFQLRQRLIVADPSTGRILWQRNQLPPDCGLYGDSAVGLFGDAQVLVLFDGDKHSYTVYRTATGEELGRGRLDLDEGQPRRAFGRKLLYVTQSPIAGRMAPPGQRVRIWDPLEDRNVFDEPVGRRLIHTETHDGELVVAVGRDEGEQSDQWERLLVLDVESGRVQLEMPLSPEQAANLNSVRAFRDRARYYINLQRSVAFPHRRAGRTHHGVSDSLLTATHMQGDLYAVDRASGRVVWQRDIEQRSFISLPHVQMPFLVAVSRLGETWPPSRGVKPSLLVEAIDPATGATLGLNDGILFPSDRLVRCTYDAPTRTVQLHGLRVVVTVAPDRLSQQIPSGDGPL